MKNAWKDIFPIGFALFALFFGAGNLIFPPYLGMTAGNEWLLGTIMFCLISVGLVLFAVIGTIRRGGPMINVTGVIGKNPEQFSTL